MKFQKILVPVLGVALVVAAYQGLGWSGVALALTGIFTWVLLHFSRMMKVLQRASDRPVGHVDSAVMLNSRLKAGVNLLHVMALTKSIGEPLSPEGADPESFRWTDLSASHVTCTFAGGKLVNWELFRPQDADQTGLSPSP